MLVDWLNFMLLGPVAIAALYYGWRQWQQGRHEQSRTTNLRVLRTNEVVSTEGFADRFGYRCIVTLTGPGVMYDVSVRVIEIGRASETEKQPVMTALSGDLEIEEFLSQEEVESGWAVVSWKAPHGPEGMIRHAVRMKIAGEGNMDLWVHRRPFHFWRWYEQVPHRVVLGSGRRRRLGKWKPIRQWTYDPQQGPLYDATQHGPPRA